MCGAALKHPKGQVGRISLRQLQPVPLLKSRVMEKEKEEEEGGDAEAGGARRSEVRGDGPQGVFGRAVDVHVLKTGTQHHQQKLKRMAAMLRQTM